MTQREKLIELIAYVQYLGGLEEKLADYLLANGVVVTSEEAEVALKKMEGEK